MENAYLFIQDTMAWSEAFLTSELSKTGVLMQKKTSQCQILSKFGLEKPLWLLNHLTKFRRKRFIKTENIACLMNRLKNDITFYTTWYTHFGDGLSKGCKPLSQELLDVLIYMDATLNFFGCTQDGHSNL